MSNLTHLIKDHKINARDLHELLEVNTKFSTWIERRISEYEFRENEDWFCFPNLGSNKILGFPHNRKDYYLTIDMAKELCLLENNHKGRVIRREFIALEKSHQHLVQEFETVQQALRSYLPTLDKNILRYKSLGLSNTEVAKLTGVLPSTISKHLRKLEAYHLIAPPANLSVLRERAKRLQQPQSAPSYAQVDGGVR